MWGGIARVHLCLWTYSGIGLICLLLVCDVCNVAMATGRVTILVNTRGLQFQSLSNDRCDVINCEWNGKVLLVSLMHIWTVAKSIMVKLGESGGMLPWNFRNFYYMQSGGIWDCFYI